MHNFMVGTAKMGNGARRGRECMMETGDSQKKREISLMYFFFTSCNMYMTAVP